MHKADLPLMSQDEKMTMIENINRTTEFKSSLNLYDNPDHLVECLQKGNDDAFEYLYDKYSKALYGVVLRIIKDSEEANDILQETFINILQKISLYDASKGSLFAWILKISRNKAIDALRNKERKYCLRLDDQNYDHLQFKWNRFSNRIHTDTIGLRELLINLKPVQREMIELYYFKGFSQQEITELKGMPLGTVKTRIRNGLQSMRTMYGIL